jgi:hypothetical protein
MERTKKLALLSVIFVAAFAAAQINAFGIVDATIQGAADTAGAATAGAANIGEAAVGGPYYRRAVVRPVVYEGQEYGTQVEPGGVPEEETMYAQPVGEPGQIYTTQPYGDISSRVEDVGY